MQSASRVYHVMPCDACTQSKCVQAAIAGVLTFWISDWHACGRAMKRWGGAAWGFAKRHNPGPPVVTTVKSWWPKHAVRCLNASALNSAWLAVFDQAH